MKRFWSFVFYFLIVGTAAAFRPYLVLYYQSLDFSGAQIGLLAGLGPLITTVSLPLMTGIADRTNRHRLMMSVGLLVFVAGLVLFPLFNSFVAIFIIMLIMTVVYAPVLPLSASAVMHMLEDRKDLYGRIRLGGTIGYSIVAIIGGTLVEHHGLRVAFWSAAALSFMAFFVGQKLEHGGEDTGKSLDAGRVSELLKNPHFLIFLVIGVFGGIGFGALNAYLFAYMKELNAAESTMGIALTVGTIVEMPVLFFVNTFIKRFGAYPVVMFSFAMTGIRFVLLALAPSAFFVLVVQLLNGLNYPLLTVAGVTYADEQAPYGFRATAQGLFNMTLGGLGAAIGGFLGGLLFDGIGARGMYLALGISYGVVLIFVTLMRRALPEPSTVTTSQPHSMGV